MATATHARSPQTHYKSTKLLFNKYSDKPNVLKSYILFPLLIVKGKNCKFAINTEAGEWR